MKKAHKLKKETTDNKTYRAIHLKDVTECPYCPPNQGCNRRYSTGRPIYKQRNWKRFRKTQWKG